MFEFKPGRVAQPVTCLTADLGVSSSFPTRFLTFLETDHEIISSAILFHSADSRMVVVSYKREYVHESESSFPRKKSVVR